MRKDQQNDKKRVIDPLADEGGWVIVDDACNSCCHGAKLHENADKKCNAMGSQTVWHHRDPAYFKGVGTKSNVGKLNFPMALLLQESKFAVPGAIASCENPDADRPMLLFQAAHKRRLASPRICAKSPSPLMIMTINALKS